MEKTRSLKVPGNNNKKEEDKRVKERRPQDSKNN